MDHAGGSVDRLLPAFSDQTTVGLCTCLENSKGREASRVRFLPDPPYPLGVEGTQTPFKRPVRGSNPLGGTYTAVAQR